MIKGIIFDLDGVIVDTARFHYQAWKRLAKELKFDFDQLDNERLKGISRMDSLNILLSIGGIRATEAEKKRYAAQKNQWFLEYIHQLTPQDVLPGVVPFLKKLQGTTIQTALGSASKNAQTILKQLHLSYLFSVIVDGTMVQAAKPDPEVFLIAAKLMHLQPSECLVFEDAIAGVIAAHRGEMRCIGVGDPKILSAADRVIPGFEKITMEILDF
ncbi:MAG: beta-phosphoglucomutase [Bacteroidales bacterium]|nr:beta-phosphoglucomutase [Bacteroidales bacterium]